jgi:NOL1/NOP2/fmu family ribosome biogenesis protein
MVAMGLRAVDLSGDGPPRPTNDLLQWLDSAISRNRLELDREGWRDLLDGRDVRVSGVERGHLALCLDGHVVGWGFVRDHRLQHHVPRGRSKWLRNVVVPVG